MRWVRTSVDIFDDPSVIALASALNIDRMGAVGACVGVFCKLPAHARDGDLSSITPDVLETWVAWKGKRGAFNRAFRAYLCTPEGVVAGWEKHNGRAIREADADRVRKENARKSARRPTDIRQTSDGHPSARPEDKSRDVTGRTTNYPSSTPDSSSSPQCANVENPPAGASSTSPADLVAAIPSAYLPALETLGTRATHPAAFYAELRMILNGAHGPRGRPVPGAVLGRALHEMAANSQPFNVVLFRGYIRRMGTEQNAPDALEAEIGRPLTSGERNFITGLRALDPAAS